MKAEEKFQNDLLYVLNNIKEKSLYTLKGKPIQYCVDYSIVIAGAEYPTAKNEASVLEKAQELGLIKILKREESPSSMNVEREYFDVEMIEPKFGTIYAKLRIPILKMEKYEQKSSESIKKIIYILDRLKDEWDLTPKQYTSQENDTYYGRYGNRNQISISHDTTIGWVRGSGLKDFFQLENILGILQEEDLILDATFRGEYE